MPFVWITMSKSAESWGNGRQPSAKHQTKWTKTISTNLHLIEALRIDCASFVTKRNHHKPWQMEIRIRNIKKCVLGWWNKWNSGNKTDDNDIQWRQWCSNSWRRREKYTHIFISQSTHPMWGHMSIFQIVYSNRRKKWMRNEIVRIVRASA